MGHLILPFIAGILTTLSPCVLPVLPFVTASSLSKSRFGPLALSLGLLITFVGSSVFLSLSGRALGFDSSTLKLIAGVGLALSGLFFVNTTLSEKLTIFFSSRLQGAHTASLKNYGSVLASEFISGLFLGLVWAPCSGPSLGAAVSLASRTDTAPEAIVMLLVFGLGAVIPLLGVAYGARRVLELAKRHSGLVNLIKKIFGFLMIIFGLMIVTGLDKIFEAQLLGLLPEAWIELITKF